MGTPGFAVPALAALAERPDLCSVVAVVTQPDRPAGRGQKLTPSAVKLAAQARGIPVLEPTKMKPPETREQLAAYAPDLAVVAAYGRILPKQLLELPKHGCLNIHASLLPRHRGASPITHAILEGDREVGVAIMQMNEGLDTGPVYAMRSRPASPDDTTGTLTVTLAEMGAQLLLDILPSILDGSLAPKPQDDAKSTYAPILKKEDGHLDFTQPAEQLERRIRAMLPWPMAYTQKGDQRITILKAHVTDGSGPPGEVIEAGKSGVAIATGKNALHLDEVQPAGKKPMPASAWAAGRGASKGDRFL
jgi:methionyl-tRNA formyltransferase